MGASERGGPSTAAESPHPYTLMILSDNLASHLTNDLPAIVNNSIHDREEKC